MRIPNCEVAKVTKRIVATVLFLAAVIPAWAVSTSHWVHGNEEDFKGGTLHNVVVTNLGDVKLSRAVQTIQQQDPDVTTVNALAEAPDGTIYAGTGPKGVLLSVKGTNVSTVATLEDTVNILSLCIDDKGGLLLGTGGDKGQVLRIDKPGDKPVSIFSAPEVQYIWALVRTDDGNLYAATGPNGQVFEIKPDGSSSEIYKSSDDNITAMIGDGKDLLYLGTDPNGLVIRLNRKTKESFIVYNAGEAEVTALAMDQKGNLYAGTGEVEERQQGQQPPPETQPKAGRPEEPANAAPIPPSQPPAPPTPPSPPSPNPGEPKPIPNSHSENFDPYRPVYLDAVNTEPTDDEPSPEPEPGQPGAPSAPVIPGLSPPSNQQGASAPPNPAEQKPEGNAIYKIDKDGFVTEIFREDVVIYSMIVQNDALIVGTGGDGNIYQVSPDAEETEVLAKVDVKQIMCLLPAHDGRIIMGTANTGGISAMTAGYATDGTYISQVLDATQVSRFGKIQLHGLLPDGTTLKVSTRSGNLKDADAPGWSDWSADVSAQEFLPVTAPSARFLQYRLTFGTTDPTQTPVVDHVDVAYQLPNLPPVIKSIRIGAEPESDASSDNQGGGAPPGAPQGPPHAQAESAPKSAGSGTQTITWDASDPNNDTLVYTLYFRKEHSGEWILLKDKLKDATYDWDTKTVADGRYQVKVVASDALSNQPGEGKTASRISSYYVVNNTPPVIGDITTTIAGKDVSVQLVAQDQTGIITNVEYALDSSEDWQTVLPVDSIYDDRRATVKFTITGLSSGSHQIAIRATDSEGNQSIVAVSARVQ